MLTLACDRTRRSQQDFGGRRVSDARPHLDDLGRWPQGHFLWPFDQVSYSRTFHSIAARAHVAFLGVEPNTQRHGGVSHDGLTGDPNLAQIKARGRWRRLLGPTVPRDSGLRSDRRELAPDPLCVGLAAICPRPAAGVHGAPADGSPPCTSR